jgi:hypothetical protein
MRRVLLIFLVLLLFLTFVSSTHAKTIEISPAYTDITLESENDEKTFELSIKNKTDKAIRLDISSLDFKQDDPNGSIAFLGSSAGNYSYSLSSFLTYDKTSLELNPKETDKVLVTVKNRQDLSPGGHYAAVIVRQTPPDNNKETIVSPALSSLIYLRKTGGERFNLSFKDVSFPKLPVVFRYPSTYVLAMQNDGNVHLTPYGRADIKDLFGRTIYEGTINEGSIKVLPQSRRNIPVYSKKVSTSFPISVNRLVISGRDSLDKTKFSYEDAFIYINPVLILALPLLALIIIIFARKKHSRKAKKND